MSWPAGTVVRWTAPSPGPGANPDGTVVDGEPDRDGLIEVQWPGIGTFKEDPIHLSRVVGDEVVRG